MVALREVFGALVHGSAGPADPAARLAEAGHGDLPEELLSWAIVNYADTLPAETAAQLAPFVIAHSGLPAATDTGGAQAAPAAATGLDLLGTAAATQPLDLPAGPEPGTTDQVDSDPLGATAPPELPLPLDADPAELDFGAGQLAAIGQPTAGPSVAAGPAGPASDLELAEPVDIDQPAGTGEPAGDQAGPVVDAFDGIDGIDAPDRIDGIDGIDAPDRIDGEAGHPPTEGEPAGP